MASNQLTLPPSSSSWAPLALSAASVGWESLESKSSNQSGEKRPRDPSPTNNDHQKEKKCNTKNKARKHIEKAYNNNEKTRKHKEKTYNNNEKARNDNENAAKLAKKQDDLPTEGFSSTWESQVDAILTFSRECSICISGRALASLEDGKVDILGYQLDSSCHQAVTVESPSWNSLITVRADAGARLSIKSICSNSIPVTRTFSVFSSTGDGVRPTILPLSWIKATDEVLGDLISKRQNRSTVEPSNSDVDQLGCGVVICGAKGVGKSTCLRYLSNRILSPCGWDHVAILDADVGQPELSPPGMITLTILRQPLLSPPHLHMVMGSGEHTPVQFSYFFGSTSPKTDPQRYLHCVKLLRTKYVQLVQEQFGGDPTQLPLIINTDGWVKGLGFQILSTLLADTLQPRHIIQIQGEFKSKMFDLDETVTGHGKLHLATAFNYSESHPSFISSTETPPRLNASVISSAAWRSLRFCTYFLGDATIWDEGAVKFGNLGIVDDDHAIARWLAAMTPYVVAMEAVTCCLLGDDARDIGTSEAALWQAVNGAIVGLCKADDKNDSTSPLPCVGLGLIRAIDRTRRLYYVLTPVDVETLQSVNVFVCGKLPLPIECLFRGKYAESFPFLSCEGLAMGVLGADPMKSRNNIARKGSSNHAS